VDILQPPGVMPSQRSLNSLVLTKPNFNIVVCPTYQEKFKRDDGLLFSFVVVPHSPLTHIRKHYWRTTSWWSGVESTRRTNNKV